VKQCIGIGRDLAKTDPAADGRVVAFAKRLESNPAVAVEPATATPGL